MNDLQIQLQDAPVGDALVSGGVDLAHERADFVYAGHAGQKREHGIEPTDAEDRC